MKSRVSTADNHIPLKKLISRYRTDLKLANYPDNQDSIDNSTKKKNFKKASVLYYLELLDDMLSPDLKD